MDRIIRFHEICGNNISLCSNRTIAYRTDSYKDGIVFSHKIIKPGEVFMIEILEVARGWSGNLRIGITQVDICSFIHTKVPTHAVPDMMSIAPSWIFSVRELSKEFWKNMPKLEDFEPLLLVQDNFIKKCKGYYSRSVFGTNPTDIGSRIGIFYIPVDDIIANLYLIVNGQLLGPVALDIEYNKAPIRAVVDVYGRTKKIKVVQLGTVTSLKKLCRNVIRRNYSTQDILNSWLPNSLKVYITD